MSLAIVATLILLGTSRVPAAETTELNAALVQRIFPEATDNGAIEGTPPAAPVYRNGQLAGYVLLTRQVVASAGYSGKPLNVAVGLDLAGRITGAEMIAHHEPILAIGVDDATLRAFADAYRGRDIRKPVFVSRNRAAGENEIAAVSGATISSVVIGDSILRAARSVARSRGLIGDGGNRLNFETFLIADWATLVADGSLVRLDLAVGDVEAAVAERQARLYPVGAGPREATASFIDLYAGLAMPARVGRNLLGDQRFNRVTAGLAEGDQLLFVAASGLYSFKGTSYIRKGIFDRLQLVQGERTHRFRKQDHIRLDDLAIAGAPKLREMALFVLAKESGFNPARPWRLEILVSGDRADGGKVFRSFARPYTLPRVYLRSAPSDAADESPGLPWLEIWRARIVDVSILVVLLAGLTVVLVFQGPITARPRLHIWLRMTFLALTLVWLGWLTTAQLSVMNVLTFVEAVRTDFRWEMFLIEPLHFILWGYVAVTLLFLGRGVFCGWLCPFGAMQEFLARLARRFGVPQIPVPFTLHEHLWALKYILFLGLFALSLGGIVYLHAAIETEPFKTAIVLGFDREWYFVLYPVLLLGAGLFIERFFCRYLCPLGAALAIPARLRMFEWLKRRWQCGQQCAICAGKCPVQAIHPDGHINPNECIHCLDCQVLYSDDAVCPPLAQRRKRSEKLQASAAAVDAALAKRAPGRDAKEDLR